MWQLEAFDKKTGLLVREHSMPDINRATLDKLIGVDLSAHDLRPGEPYGYDVPASVLPKLAKFVVGDFAVDESCDYQVGNNKV